MPPQQPQNQNPAPPPPVSPPPMPPQMPQQEVKHTMLPALLILLVIVALCSGAYLLWAKGFLDSFMPQQVAETQPPPPKTETSDLEAELQSVDINSDAEIESLEAQI